jgi:hypothetical protein
MTVAILDVRMALTPGHQLHAGDRVTSSSEARAIRREAQLDAAHVGDIRGGLQPTFRQIPHLSFGQITCCLNSRGGESKSQDSAYEVFRSVGANRTITVTSNTDLVDRVTSIISGRRRHFQ